MKHILVLFLVVSSFLQADTFEEEHKEEIQTIIKRWEQKKPGDYFTQKYWIEEDIKALKEIYELKQKVKND